MDQSSKQMVAGACRGGNGVALILNLPDYSIMSLSPLVHSFVSVQQRQTCMAETLFTKDFPASRVEIAEPASARESCEELSSAARVLVICCHPLAPTLLNVTFQLNWLLKTTFRDCSPFFFPFKVTPLTLSSCTLSSLTPLLNYSKFKMLCLLTMLTPSSSHLNPSLSNR